MNYRKNTIFFEKQNTIFFLNGLAGCVALGGHAMPVQLELSAVWGKEGANQLPLIILRVSSCAFSYVATCFALRI